MHLKVRGPSKKWQGVARCQTWMRSSAHVRQFCKHQQWRRIVHCGSLSLLWHSCLGCRCVCTCACVTHSSVSPDVFSWVTPHHNWCDVVLCSVCIGSVVCDTMRACTSRLNGSTIVCEIIAVPLVLCLCNTMQRAKAPQCQKDITYNLCVFVLDTTTPHDNKTQQNAIPKYKDLVNSYVQG